MITYLLPLPKQISWFLALLLLLFSSSGSRAIGVTPIVHKRAMVAIITANPTNLTLATTQGTASVPMPFTLSATGFPNPGNILVETPSDVEVSDAANGPYSDKLNVSVPNGTLVAKTLYTRIKALATLQSGLSSIELSGASTEAYVSLSTEVTSAPIPPTVTVTPTNLTGFNTIAGTPSAPQSFTLSAANMPGNATIAELFVSAPSLYEVSQWANGPFSGYIENTAVINPNRSLSPQTYFIRLIGVAGSVTNKPVTTLVAGVDPATKLTVSGTVTASPNNPTSSASPNNLTGFTGQTTQSYVFSGSGFASQQEINVTPPINFEITDDLNHPFSQQIFIKTDANGAIQKTLYVRLKANAPANASGSVTHALNGNLLPTTVAVSSANNPPPPGGSLQLLAPLYNCQTGAFTFQTSGGNGTIIEYQAAGITGWTSNPNQFVDQGLRTAADAKPLTLKARQSGQQVSYTWDIRAVCPVGGNPPPPPPPGNALQLLAPAYNCQSGAFMFKTSGGNGTTIEYQAAGITGWTSNPNQFVDQGLRTAADAKPLTLKARQSGQQVSYIWDIRAICPVGAPRLAASQETNGVEDTYLKASVYPTPMHDALTVVIEGAAGQAVRLCLVDVAGHTVVDKQIDISTTQHQERLNVAEQGAGLYLLRVNTTRQVLSLKVVKQ